MAAALLGVYAVIGVQEVDRSYSTIDLIAALVVARGFIGFTEARSRFAHFLGSRPFRLPGEFSHRRSGRFASGGPFGAESQS
jgi:hypothetical protein